MPTEERRKRKTRVISRCLSLSLSLSLSLFLHSQARPPIVILSILHQPWHLGRLLRLGGVQGGLDLQRAHALLLRVGAWEGHGAGGVGGVVQQGVDLVDEEGVEALRDLLLVGEGEGALEGDPVCAS